MLNTGQKAPISTVKTKEKKKQKKEGYRTEMKRLPEEACTPPAERNVPAREYQMRFLPLGSGFGG